MNRLTKYIILSLGVFFISNVKAASITWTNGSGDGNWNTALNWDLVSVPGASDLAIFDATSIANCDLNLNLSVGGIDIQAGYSGTITVLAGNTLTVGLSDFNQANAVFVGGNSTFTCNGHFNLSGGTFTSTTAKLRLNRDLNFTGGTFNHNSGEVEFIGNNRSITGFVSFYDVTLNNSNNWNINDDIDINNTFLMKGPGGIKINGPGIVNCKGDIDLQNTSYYCGGTGTINITGAVDQSIISTVIIRKNQLPNVIIDKSGGTATFSGIISINRNWTYIGGIVDHASLTSTIAFAGSNQSLNGVQDFHNVTLHKANDWNVNDDINVNSKFLMQGGGGTKINGPGIVNCKGDIELKNTSFYCGGTGTINITGVLDQSIVSTAVIRKNQLPNVIIDKSGGTATFSGIISISRNWTYIGGLVDHSTLSSTIAFTGSNQSVSGAQDFYNVTFHKSNDWNVNDDININNTFLMQGGSGYKINGPGIVSCKGDVLLDNTSVYGGGNGTVKIAGGIDQSIASSVTIRKNPLPNVIIDKSGGTATFSGTISTAKNWTYTAGTVDHATLSSVIAFTGSNQSVNGVQDFHNVTLHKSNDWNVSDDINVNNTFLMQGGSGTRINGPGIVSCKGDVLLDNTSVYGGGNGTVKIAGAIDQSIASSVTIRRNPLPNVIIDKSGGTATFSGTISTAKNWTYTVGTVDHATLSSVIAFTGSNQSVNGVQDFHNVTLHKSNDWNVSDDINVNNTFLMQGGSGIRINGPGIVSCKGDVQLDNTSVYGGGNGTVKIAGAIDQSIVSTVAIRQNQMPNFVIDKLGGTATFNGTVSINRNWTYTAGTVDHATLSSVIAFTGSNQSVNGVQDFHNVTLYKSNDWDVTNDININNVFLMQGGNGIRIDGPGIVSCKGDIDLQNTSLYGGGNGTVKITGAVDQIITSTVDIARNKLPNVIIDKSGGTATFSGIVSVNLDWTYIAGIVDHATFFGTIGFTGGNQNVNGVQDFYNVTLSKVGNWNINNDININNTFFIRGGSHNNINGPSIVSCKGDIDLQDTNPYFNGNGTVKITGTVDQTITSTVSSGRCRLPNVIIDKTGGTATLIGTISFAKNFTYVQGGVDATSNLSTLVSLGSGSLIDGESIAGVEMIFYDFTLNSTTVVQTLTGNIEVDNKLRLQNTRLNMNTNEITLNNSDSAAFTRIINGIIKSEATDNSAKLNWNIGTDGVEHVILFGNASNTKIPFIFQNTDGGDLGVFSVSTYPTAPNNVPFPSSPIVVTNMGGEYVADNTPFTIDRFWQIDKTGGAGTVDMTFTYAQTDVSLGVLGNEDILEAQRYETATNVWQPALGGQTQDAASNMVSVGDVTTFSPWTLAINTSPLPIELISFTAKNKDKAVELNWVTASEINNDYFTVERSVDGENFEFVCEQNGAGNSTIELHYSDLDRSPVAGISYYRLKQTDFDGTNTYSERVAIQRDWDETQVIIYPNPSNGMFNIINGIGALSILDMSGKVVYTENIVDDFTQIELPSLASGVYLVKILNVNGTKTTRLILN